MKIPKWQINESSVTTSSMQPSAIMHYNIYGLVSRIHGGRRPQPHQPRCLIASKWLIHLYSLISTVQTSN